VTSLVAPRIAVKKSGKNDILFGNAAGAPGNRSYYWSLNDLKTHVFSSYPHLCIYVSMYLCSYRATHGLYVDWLQAVLERNRRCAARWESGEQRAVLAGRDRASLEMHMEAMIERNWRSN
jgi:hypothetical protein